MSGPLKPEDDVPASPMAEAEAAHPNLELIEGRRTQVGAMEVNRVLPRRARRTVGPWCFFDHMTPFTVSPENALEVGPHPHMGLQTVTWLISGEVVHRDSLGVEQSIKPGQLNLMTAGHGVAHAEQSPVKTVEKMHGVQMWVAQPDVTRNGVPRFEHHAELPLVSLANVDATVIVGEFEGEASPATSETDHVGVELNMRAGTSTVPLRRAFEHAFVVLEGTVRVGDQIVTPGNLAYVGSERDEIGMVAAEDARVLLIGGEPFTEPLLMWWNFVARSREEINAAHQDWESNGRRFGKVDSPLARIPSPRPQWLT